MQIYYLSYQHACVKYAKLEYLFEAPFWNVGRMSQYKDLSKSFLMYLEPSWLYTAYRRETLLTLSLSLKLLDWALLKFILKWVAFLHFFNRMICRIVTHNRKWDSLSSSTSKIISIFAQWTQTVNLLDCAIQSSGK